MTKAKELEKFKSEILDNFSFEDLLNYMISVKERHSNLHITFTKVKTHNELILSKCQEVLNLILAHQQWQIEESEKNCQF